MHAAGDDAEELPLECLLDRQAFVRSEDADPVNLAGLHHHSVSVGVLLGSVPNVSVEARVLVLRAPDRAGVVEVVGEQDLNIAV